MIAAACATCDAAQKNGPAERGRLIALAYQLNQDPDFILFDFVSISDSFIPSGWTSVMY